MDFRTKDLMITVLPKEVELAKQNCLLRSRICLHPTYCRFFTNQCYHPTLCRYPSWCPGHSCLGNSCGFSDCLFSGGCGPISPYCGISHDPWVIQQVDDIKGLREELQSTLKQLDELERTGLSTQVDSLEAAEALEEGLEAALKELRDQKAKLSKKGR